MSSSTTTTLSMSDLKKKSQDANDLIEKLQKQIEQIKLLSTPEYMAEQTKKLKKENEDLRKQVEKLKKDLEEAEAKNKGNKSKNKPVAAESGKKAAQPAEQKSKLLLL
jgi:hypothetical protein